VVERPGKIEWRHRNGGIFIKKRMTVVQGATTISNLSPISERQLGQITQMFRRKLSLGKPVRLKT
jgi:hypothetical protein